MSDANTPLTAGPMRYPLGRSVAFGFAGILPAITNRSTIHPVTTATSAESKMNMIIHFQPISAARISVSDSEFHGLAMRKAIV